MVTIFLWWELPAFFDDSMPAIVCSVLVYLGSHDMYLDLDDNYKRLKKNQFI
jgi:hypothetical protein